jgi:hypothetical protein
LSSACQEAAEFIEAVTGISQTNKKSPKLLSELEYVESTMRARGQKTTLLNSPGQSSLKAKDNARVSMTLLREIQLAATDGNVDISTVLRKAEVLAARLQNLEFEVWVNRELNGYSEMNDIPPYRIIPVHAEADLHNFGTHWRGAAVMSSFLPEKLRWWAEICYLKQPIASIAEMIGARPKSGQYSTSWPQEMAVKYGAKGYNNFECLGARQIFTVNSLAGVVDTVRNRILEFALKIEKGEPRCWRSCDRCTTYCA